MVKKDIKGTKFPLLKGKSSLKQDIFDFPEPPKHLKVKVVKEEPVKKPSFFSGLFKKSEKPLKKEKQKPFVFKKSEPKVVKPKQLVPKFPLSKLTVKKQDVKVNLKSTKIKSSEMKVKPVKKPFLPKLISQNPKDKISEVQKISQIKIEEKPSPKKPFLKNIFSKKPDAKVSKEPDISPITKPEKSEPKPLQEPKVLFKKPSELPKKTKIQAVKELGEKPKQSSLNLTPDFILKKQGITEESKAGESAKTSEVEEKPALPKPFWFKFISKKSDVDKKQESTHIKMPSKQFKTLKEPIKEHPLEFPIRKPTDADRFAIKQEWIREGERLVKLAEEFRPKITPPIQPKILEPITKPKVIPPLPKTPQKIVNPKIIPAQPIKSEPILKPKKLYVSKREEDLSKEHQMLKKKLESLY